MIRLRRASVIVALSLLTSAATAYAECAWVLWVESRRVGEGAPPGGYTIWDVKDGYDKRVDCVKGMDAVEKEWQGLITPDSKHRPIRFNDIQALRGSEWVKTGGHG